MSKILTVSVAAYNVEQYIEECLKPFAECKNKDMLEVLVIDDGGCDNTINIAREFERRYPSVFKVVHKNNGGWGSTLNYAFSNATGKYFKQLDGDDFFDVDNLDSFLEYLHDSNSDIVYSPFTTFSDKDGRILGGSPCNSELTGRLFDIDEAIRLVTPAMHAITVKTEIIRNNHIEIMEHCFYTDIEFILYIFVNCKTVSFFDKTIYQYRMARSGQSSSMDGLVRHNEDHLRVIFKLLSYMKEHSSNIPNNLLQYITERMCRMCGAQYGIYTMMPSTQDNKDKLLKYDMVLKTEYPYYYEHCTCGKITRLFRKNGFKQYNLMMMYYKLKYLFYHY